MEFEQQKLKQLSKKDKSNIGKWDEKIIKLCNKLNKSDKYYTTSGCGGRVVLLKGLNKKQKNVFLFKSHKKVSFNELKKALKTVEYNGLVEFKMSSCILHVACKSMKDAQKLVNKAKQAGWKRSGVMGGKRNVVELLSTENLEFPIMNKRKLLVDDDFLKIVVKQANKKLFRTWKKIDKLEKLV